MSAFSRKYEYICPLKMFYKYDRDTFGRFLVILVDNGANDEELNQQILERLKKYVTKFVGTHNYHNYTKKGDPKKKTNVRYIMSMDVQRVSHEELEEIWGKKTSNQYVRFRLHGQSFIYHQIRKMVGSLIQLFQEGNDEEFIVNTFCLNKTPVWLAPSQGLLLDRVRYQ